MNDFDFKNAVEAIVKKEYNESNVKAVKRQLSQLLKKEVSIKQKLEKETSEYIKNKHRIKTELNKVHNDIKDIRNLLKNI